MSDTSTPNLGPTRSLNFEALKVHVITHKINCGLWLIRVLGILFSIAYFIPIFGNSYNYYYKVLLANAAISALRLHQRIGRVQFTRQFAAELLSEDSCHYLFYSLIFLYVSPVSCILFLNQDNKLLSFLRTLLHTRYGNDSIAKLSNVYGIDVSKMEHVGNVINHLSDNTAAKAKDMVEALAIVGGTAKQFGLDIKETSSLVNAFVSLGKQPAKAGTAINALLSKLQTAEGQGKEFKVALESIVVLVPIVLFCILHSASYSLTLLDTLGQNSWWGARLLISLVEFQSLNILKAVAFTEIFLMPYTVLLIFLGRASLLTPFIYYHFLTQRYTSRRNPYTRNMFRELRVLFENTAAKPSMPSFVKQIILFVVNFTSKLAPVQMQMPQPQQEQ